MKLKKVIWILLSCFTLLATAPAVYAGSMQLPNYAQGGNLNTDTQAKGKRVTDYILLVTAIICVAAFAVSAALFGMNKHDEAKKVFQGAVIGLLIGGMIYGLAAMLI